jgi:repressor LexA
MKLAMERNLLKVYDFIINFRANVGYPPSIREIMAALSIKSTSTVHSYLKKLDQKGYIRISTKNKSRAIELPATVPDGASLALPPICNTPDYTQNKALNEYKTLNSYLLNQTKDLIVVRMPDNAFVELLIKKNDYLIVKKTRETQKNDLQLLKDSKGYLLKRTTKNQHYSTYIEPIDNINEPQSGIIGTVICLVRDECINPDCSKMLHNLE